MRVIGILLLFIVCKFSSRAEDKQEGEEAEDEEENARIHDATAKALENIEVAYALPSCARGTIIDTHSARGPQTSAR